MILIVVIFISFIFQIIFDDYTKALSLLPNRVLRGEIYRLITSIFLHGDFTHLFFNSFALLMFGGILERIIGYRNFLLIFFFSGILGGLAYVLTAYLLNETQIPAVGASGSIYGIIGALAILRPTTIVLVYFVPIPLLFLAFFWIITETIATLFQFFGLKSSIASQAHLVGLLFGLIYGKKIKSKKTKIKVKYYYY